MNIRTSFFVLFAFSVLTTNTTFAQTATTSPQKTTTAAYPVLTLGSRGSFVLNIQSQLAQLNYLSSNSVTGYFGPLTQKAVQRFQCDTFSLCSGRPSSNGYGSVGPKTKTALANTVTGGATAASSSSSLTNSLMTQLETLKNQVISLMTNIPNATTTCTPDWHKGDWSACASSGMQTRTVTDNNNCNTNTNQPATSQFCTYTSSTMSSSCTLNGNTIANGASITAYQLTGSSCLYQVRICYNGSLTGTYTATSCSTQSQSQTNTTTCVPHWTMTDWGACAASNTQTRTVTDTNNCNTTSNKPAASQSCTYVAPAQTAARSCTPNWSKSDWGACASNGTQTRTVVDTNNCNTTTDKPAASQSCTYVSAPSIAATLLGLDGSDVVSTSAVTPDGTKDEHIRLTGVTKSISKVHIKADLGWSEWWYPYSVVNWIVGVKPESNPAIVDLYFDFNKDWSYNVEIYFTDGTSVSLDAKPVLSCSSNQACFDNALNNLYSHFWTGSHDTGYVTPTGWTGIVGGSFAGSDSRGSTWPAAEFVNVLYTKYLLNPTDANAQPIRAEWNHLKSIFSDRDFTAVGASSPMNTWSDDLGWNMEMLLEMYDVTHDAHLLSLAKTGMQNGYDQWHNSDSRFGGGMWYTDDHTNESLIAEGRNALNFYRLYQYTGDLTMLAKSEELYNWMQNHLSHSDDIYYAYYGWWDSDNKATDSPHVDWWGTIAEGGPDVSQTTIPGVMAMDIMHARLYKLTGDSLYKQRALATARGMLKVFIGNNNGAFFDNQDAWINGSLIREWVVEVYPLLSSDLQQQAKTAFQRTAVAIQMNDITSDGYYGPDWAGPVDAIWSNGAADCTNKQIMTNTQAVDYIAAPALIDFIEKSAPSALPPDAQPAVTGSLLGIDGNDVVGTVGVGADGIGDEHIKLSNVKSPITGVLITSPNGTGMWQWPTFTSGIWPVSVQPESNASVVDVYFEYYLSYWTYNLFLKFKNGMEQTVTVP